MIESFKFTPIQLQEHKKCWNLFTEMKIYFVCIFEWCNRFRQGCEDLEDDPRCMGHQQFDIHKQVQKFMNWLPEIVNRP